MRKVLKFGVTLVTMMLALTCFVACSNDDDDASGSVEGWYTYEVGGVEVYLYLNSEGKVERGGTELGESSDTMNAYETLTYDTIMQAVETGAVKFEKCNAPSWA